MVGEPASGTAGCITTDWNGVIVAHGVTGPFGEDLDRAVRDEVPLDDLVSAHPDLSLTEVADDLRHESRSPLGAHGLDGTPFETVLALDGFSQGCWLVETASGSRHAFDLDRGTYRRLGGPEAAELAIDDDWYYIAFMAVWPAVNSTFGVALLVPPEDGSTAQDQAVDMIQLTSTWVTRIIKVPQELLEGALPALAPVTEVEALTQAPPQNAWILMGSERSLLDPDDLADEEGYTWTVPKHVQRGDLALMYYVAPIKSVLYAARIQSPPLYEPPLLDEEDRATYPHQWWASINAITPTDPVDYLTLRDLFDGQLVLRGRAGTYVPPGAVRAIRDAQASDPRLDLVLQLPTGEPGLPPDPKAMTLAEWSRLAAGRFKVELHVEDYVVKPLLEMIVDMTPGTAYQSKAHLGTLVPDFSLYLGAELAALVEVKLGIRGRQDGREWAGPDVDQLFRYCSRANVPGLLIDANRVMLFELATREPVAVLERSRMTQAEVGIIARHVFPGRAGAAPADAIWTDS